MSKKEFKTYRKLISILRVRGMSIKKGSEGSRIIRILQNENYYNIINGYKKLFIKISSTSTTDEVYKDGTTFDEVYFLYLFDRELRNIHLKYLLKLENNFKSIVSHSFSKKYGHDNYLKLENFNNSSSKDAANIIRLISDIQQEIARQLSKNNEMISHYIAEHGYIPLWVLINVLTFGKITNFYFNMKESDKIVIAKEFGVQYRELHKYMTMLGFARNKCAHGERFYDISFSQRIHSKSIKNFSILGLPRDKSGSYIKGTCDAYSIAIIFKQLLSKQDFREFYFSIETAIKKLTKHIHTINVDEILYVMGYTNNWKNILKL